MEFIATSNSLIITTEKGSNYFYFETEKEQIVLLKIIKKLQKNTIEIEQIDEYIYSQINKLSPQIHQNMTKLETIIKHFPEDFKIEHNNLYMKGYHTIVNDLIVNYIYDSIIIPNYKFTSLSLINFYRMLMLNIDLKIRDDIFEWFSKGLFTITENGFIIGYRNVIKKSETPLAKFINKSVIKLVKKNKNLKLRYIRLKPSGEYELIKKKEVKYYKSSTIVGCLNDLYNERTQEIKNELIYTDNYSQTMTIKMYRETFLDRDLCDNNPNNSCSSGLHIKTHDYAPLAFGDTALICLIAPYDVVAIPTNEPKKFRCCAYTPIGYADVDDSNNITPIEEGSINMQLFEGHLLKKTENHILDNYETLATNVFDEQELKEMVKLIENRIVTIGKPIDE